MLKPEIYELLNKQITLEYYSSNLYLQMSSWFINKGMDGCGRFMRLHAEEEREHMIRLFDYVNETGAYAVIEQIEPPRSSYETARDVFVHTYEHECHVTNQINDLAAAAFKASDFSTFNFLQWYVGEQHEEEQLFQGILDKIDLIGPDSSAMFYLDQEVGKMADQRVRNGESLNLQE